MEVKSVVRWELPSEKPKRSFRYVALLALAGVSATIYALSLAFPLEKPPFSSHLDVNQSSITEGIANELRLSVSSDEARRVPELVEAVSKLTSRVEALEKERNRLTSEMNELAGDDGVIARIVTHVRALHAKIEATRHDVVDAMMSPLPESQPAIGEQGRESETTMDGEGSPFMTKARHTIVTPVASASRVAEKVEASPKHKGMAAHPAPGEGNTN